MTIAVSNVRVSSLTPTDDLRIEERFMIGGSSGVDDVISLLVPLRASYNQSVFCVVFALLKKT